ncbi:MAG: DUF6783 domain-containing protein [Ruminococcus sp.]
MRHICGRFCPDEGAVAGLQQLIQGKNIPQSGACRLRE